MCRRRPCPRYHLPLLDVVEVLRLVATASPALGLPADAPDDLQARAKEALAKVEQQAGTGRAAEEVVDDAALLAKCTQAVLGSTTCQVKVGREGSRRGRPGRAQTGQGAPMACRPALESCWWAVVVVVVIRDV